MKNLSTSSLFSIDFETKVLELSKRLNELTILEEKDQTSYTGKDLNLLEKIVEKICNETITEEDILNVEKLIFKFL
jgi:hypothetical protein